MTSSTLAQAVGDLDEATAVRLVEEKLAAGEIPSPSWKSFRPA